MPPRRARGSVLRQSARNAGSGRGRAFQNNRVTATAKRSTISASTARKSTRRGKSQPNEPSNAASLDSGGVEEVAPPAQARSVPQSILKERYCLFCFEQDGTRAHHSVPSAVEIQELESNLLRLQRELNDRISEDAPHVNHTGDVSITEQQQSQHRKYNVLLWQYERGKELRKKGFGTAFDLWIDHLTLAEMISDGWSYEEAQSRIPEDWIEDTETPAFLVDTQPRFPPGTEQRGDIEAEVAALDEEGMLDAIDDRDQQAEADIYRIRNISPIPRLDDEDDQPVGENLGLEAAHAAINRLRTKSIPQTIRMWRDNAKPFTDRDSKLQMKDYLLSIHHITEPGASQNPSTETYRAIANIAFSMESANRLWRNKGITDEGYSKLTRDGFQQLAALRGRLDEAGVTGLPPPSSDASPVTKPRQQKPLRPFVIDRWMDARDNELHRPYAYTPERPLGPMISENAHTSRPRNGESSSADLSYDRHGFVNLSQHTGRSSNIKLSREEIMGLNMELDQLVEDA